MASPATRPLKAVVLLVWAVAGSACYSEQVVTTGLAQPDNQVRVVLTRSGAGELASTIGDSASAVSGSVIRNTDAGLTLSVRQVERGNARVEWRGEQATIPLAAIDHVAIRHLDRTRSVVTAAGVTVATLALRALFLGSEAVGGNKGAVGVGAQ